MSENNSNQPPSFWQTNRNYPYQPQKQDQPDAWEKLREFGIERPGGNLVEDLSSDKKVLLRRGISLVHAAPAPDFGSNIIQFVASTDGVKRDGNEILNSGWHFENFSRNPVFLYCHDYHSLPIGKHVDWRVDKGPSGENVLRIWSQFCSRELYEFADRVRQMYVEGYLRAGSIGWIPLKHEAIRDPDGYIKGFRFLENDLLEFSAVPVPADPNALVEAIGRGFLSTDEAKKYGNLAHANSDLAYTLSNLDPVYSESGVKTEVKTIRTEEEKPVEEQPVVVEAEPVTEEIPAAEETRTEPEPVETVKSEIRDVDLILTEIRSLGSSIDRLVTVIESREVTKTTEEVPVEEAKAEEIQTEATLTVETVVEAAVEEAKEVVEDVEQVVIEAVQEAEQPQASAVENTLTRVGAKISKENLGYLKTCRDHMSKAHSSIGDGIRSIEDMLSQLQKEDDPEATVLEDKINEPASGYSIDNAETVGRLFGSLERIAKNLGVVPEPEPEPVVEGPSVEDRLSKLGKFKAADEPKSDYARSILDRLKSLNI